MNDYIIGEWWIPGNKEKKVQGILIFDTEEYFAQLEVFGNLNFANDSFITINGLYDGKKEIALYQCLNKSTSKTLGEPSSTREIYNVTRVFKGIHAESDGKIYLDNLSAKFTETNKWSGLTSFEIDQSFNDRSFGLKTKESEVITAKIDDNTSLEINLLTSVPLIFDTSVEELRLKQECYFTFQFENKVDFEKAELEYVRHVQNFLIVAISEPVYIKKLISANKITDEHFQEVSILQEYEIEVRRKLHRHDMHFTLSDFKDEIGFLLETWYSKKDNLKHVLNSYLSRRLSKSFFEDYFLGLSRSLELYHRFFIGTKEINAEKKSELIENVKLKVDEKYHDTVLPKLSHVDEPSFNKRISETCEKFSSIVDKIISIKSFSHKVALLRNYWTHYESKYETEINAYNTFVLSDQLSVLLDICLLSEIGFSNTEIEDIIENRSDYNILKNNKSAT